jgi:glycosyltransferase involved in cell wall biosynthesis
VRDDITGLILTYDEAPNIGRTLQALNWLRQVIVVDSFSADETETIARRFQNVTFVKRAFDTHAAQWNFGVAHVQSNWVLALDADYLVTEELQSEIASLREAPGISAYFARFRYCVFGRPLRASLYPPRAVLFQKAKCQYIQDGHTQALAIDGPSHFLRGFMLHDDRKPLSRWLESQRRYAELEAKKLIAEPGHLRSLADRLRRSIWPAAPAAFLYTLFAKRCILDGWPGWYYVLQRTYAELLLALALLDSRLNRDYPLTESPSPSCTDRND